MNFKSKKVMLTIIVTMALSWSLLIETTTAPVTVPANPRPAPEIISVIIHNNPIWKPPVTYTDAYTGDITYSNPGYFTSNGSIEITIKNRPFTTYTDKNGKYQGIYYTFFWKHSTTPWSDDFPRSLEPYAEYQSDTTNTIVTFTYGTSGIYVTQENTIIDFRIQSVEGHHTPRYETRDFSSPLPFLYDVPAVYDGIGSKYIEFSIKIPSTEEPGTYELNIQTSTITPTKTNPTNTQTTTQNTTTQTTTQNTNPDTQPQQQNPQQTHLITILITIGIIIIPIAIVMGLNKQQKRKINQTFNDTNNQTL